jgi:hypothetical protein
LNPVTGPQVIDRVSEAAIIHSPEVLRFSDHGPPALGYETKNANGAHTKPFSEPHYSRELRIISANGDEVKFDTKTSLNTCFDGANRRLIRAEASD